MLRPKLRRTALHRAQALARAGQLEELDMESWLHLDDVQRRQLLTTNERTTHKESSMSHPYNELLLSMEDMVDGVAQKHGDQAAHTLALKLASEVATAFPTEAYKAVGGAALSFKTRYKASMPAGMTTIELPSDLAAALEKARAAAGGDAALLVLLHQAAGSENASETTATKAGRMPTFAEMVRGEIPNVIDDRRPR